MPDHSVHSKFSFNIPENIDPGTQEIKIKKVFGGYDTAEIFIVPTIDGFYYSNENELSLEGGKYSYNFSDGSDKILIISGSNFGDIPHEVRLIQSNGNDYNTMNIISWEFDRITCQIPDNFTNGYIEIVYNSGEFEEEVDMDLDKEINFYPVITSIYNSSNNNFGNYSYNDIAEISGINLVGGIRKLYIDNNEYPYNSWYNNKVTLNIPNLSTGNHNIRLEIDGRNTNTVNFNFMGE